jgi:hypothetical protein
MALPASKTPTISLIAEKNAHHDLLRLMNFSAFCKNAQYLRLPQSGPKSLKGVSSTEESL